MDMYSGKVRPVTPSQSSPGVKTSDKGYPECNPKKVANIVTSKTNKADAQRRARGMKKAGGY